MTAPKEHPTRQPCRRLEVLALLATPMTRHAIGEALGTGYAASAVHVATLQAQGLVTPCGHERTPGGRTWRMLFRNTPHQAGKHAGFFASVLLACVQHG
jgi:predicted ArsR family transcriptional regulator